MKKICMLLGLVVLNTAIIAMDQPRPVIYKKLDQKIARMPGQYITKKDWDAIYSTLKSAKGSAAKDLVNKYRTPMGNTILHEAVIDRNLPAVKELLKKYKADPNIGNDRSGVTPLMLACLSGDANLLVLLLSHGGNTMVRDYNNQTSFDYANKSGNDDFIMLLNAYTGD